MSTHIPRAGAAAGATLLAAVTLAACGGGSNTSNSATPTSPATTATTNAPAKTQQQQPSSAITASLPSALKSQYVHLPNPPKKSPWADYKGAKKPWKICYSESYVGNPWRVSLANHMKHLAAEYKSAGFVSGFTMSVSNNDVARQNQQIRQFADQNCSVIFTVAGSSTGLNQAIAAAHAKGIPVVTIAGSVTSPYAVNVDSNYYLFGENMARPIVKSGAKNVLMVEGIKGSPIAGLENEGGKAVFKQAGTKIVAEVNGNWTPSVTKQVVLKALATHPEKIDAVWTSGSESAVIAAAFDQAGRPQPLITASISGDQMGYWNEHKDTFKFSGAGVLPAWTAETGWRVGMRLLAGKQPKIDPIMVPIPLIDEQDLPKVYESCMTPTASNIFPVMPEDPLPNKLMNAYFSKPGEVGPYSHDKIPSPCS